MKSNFKVGRLLCCILLALVMTLGNASAILSGLSDENNKVYAATYYQGYVGIEPIRLNSDVKLTGTIYYTAYYDYYGRQAFYSIDGVDSYLVGDIADYEWYPGAYTYTLSGDYYGANVRLYGQLKEKGFFWDSIDDVVKDCEIWF